MTLRDVFERPLDDEDDPRLQVARVLTRAEAEAVLEHRGNLIAALTGWQPMETAPKEPGAYINVRSVTTYRWLPYKKDGARQMGKPGRWQMAKGEYGGWENAELPVLGEWKPNPPVGPGQ